MNVEKIFVNTSEVDENTLSSPFVKVDLKNVKQKKVPTTPEEFLLSVIAERQSIEEVTRCNVDYSKFNKNQSLFYDGELVATAPDNLKPTKEWQNIQVADFSEIRSYYSRMRSLKTPESKRIKRIVLKKSMQDNLQWWREYFASNMPSLSIVYGFNAMQVDKGLEMLTLLLKEIKCGDTIDRKIGLWIYALLICLKQPLLSDTVSIIRDLARQCAAIRSSINPESENSKQLAAPFNLIICIVAVYFRQLDLADNSEFVNITDSL